MKALSVAPNWGMMILYEYKSIECRSWSTPYRGDLLICTTQKPTPDCIAGHALCVVRLADVVPFKKAHLYDAGMEEVGMPPKGSFAWLLEDVRPVRPFRVKGQQGFFDVDDSLIELLPVDKWTQEESDAWIKANFLPLIYKPARL